MRTDVRPMLINRAMLYSLFQDTVALRAHYLLFILIVTESFLNPGCNILAMSSSSREVQILEKIVLKC